MSISITSGFRDSVPIAAPNFHGRLSRLMAAEPESNADAAGKAAVAESPDTWTPQMLRAALVNIGTSPTPANMALAEALVQFGLPLTAAALNEANSSLARAGNVSALSYAMARLLKLPPTPSILQALSMVTGGIPTGRSLPPDISDWLSLALEGDMNPEAMAAQLYLMINQRGRSTENRLSFASSQENSVFDSRTLLMRLAQGSVDKQISKGADALASHIEGQQLLNAVARRTDDDTLEIPLYFALPLRLAGEQVMLELSIWPWEDNEEDDDLSSEEDFVRAVFRLEPGRLGPLQVEILGSLRGNMRCRIAAARQATVRLLKRNTESLAGSLALIGWPVCEVSCAFQDQWPPLWHGGTALSTPRARVDWRA